MREIDKNYSYIRNNSYPYRYGGKKSSVSNNVKRIDKKLVEKVANQFIISAAIALIVILLSNFNSSITNKVVESAKWTASTDYNFKSAAVNIKDNVLPSISGIFKTTSAKLDVDDEKVGAITASSNNITDIIMPIDGQISSGFGMRKSPITGKDEQHYGIDISGEKGAPIKAPLDGVVEKIEDSKMLGRVLKIRHDSGIETIYGHCSEILVDENQVVEQGQFIAKVGDTGEAVDVHLHFEILKNGIPEDPLDIIGSAAKPN